MTVLSSAVDLGAADLRTPIAFVVASALVGVLLGPAAAATTVTVPGGRWPWQTRSLTWLMGAPATILRRAVLAVFGFGVLASLAVVIGWRVAAVAFLTMGLVGLVLGVIDLEHHRLPDRLTAFAAVAGGLMLGVDAALTDSWSALLRAFACAAVTWVVFLVMALISPRGMGFGDVKLAALLSLHTGWLGWEIAAVGVLAGFVLGGVAAVLLLALRRADLRTPIAFGPALLLGSWLTVLAVAT